MAEVRSVSSDGTMAAARGTDADVQHVPSPHGRKRGRYTPHACQRCQKAKVRCDGRLPCAYCATREGECHYSVQAPPNFQGHVSQSEDDQSGFHAEISTLLRQQNEKLDLLIKKTATIEAAYETAEKSDASTAAAVLPPRKQPLPLFQTSTSAFFCVNVVNAGIRKLGLDFPQDQTSSLEPAAAQTRTALSIIHGEVVDGESSDISRSELEDVRDSAFQNSPNHSDDSTRSTAANLINELDRDLLLQAVQAFADLECPKYPILDMANLMQNARCFSETAFSLDPGRRRYSPEQHDISKEDLAIVKMVVAIGLLAEGDIRRKLALRLMESLRSTLEAMIWSAAVDLKDLVLMTLVTLFHFHCGRWRLAWRFLGNVSRIILELGLNRRMVLDRSFSDIKSRVQAINTIWTIFVLEQHLSYALGFSNAMPNLRLESNFPQPVDAPFLSLMIEYASIGRQSCDALLSDKVLSPEQLTTWQDDYAYFQYRVSLWAIRASESFVNDSLSSGLQMVHTILYLRAIHLRTLVARAFLCSGLRKAAPLDIWTTSVDDAADTIEVLTQLDSSKKEYLFHQAQFNHFLISALDILLFATTHKSSGVGSPSANGEELFISNETARKAQQSSMIALNRLRSLAKSSTQSKYLWDRVHGVALRLNLSGYLFSGASETAMIPSAQAEAEAPNLAHTAVDTGLAVDHSAPLTDLDPSQFDSQMLFSLPLGDTGTWESQLPPSSGLDFDLTQDFSTPLNTTWMP